MSLNLETLGSCFKREGVDQGVNIVIVLRKQTAGT